MRTVVETDIIGPVKHDAAFQHLNIHALTARSAVVDKNAGKTFAKSVKNIIQPFNMSYLGYTHTSLCILFFKDSFKFVAVEILTVVIYPIFFQKISQIVKHPVSCLFVSEIEYILRTVIVRQPVIPVPVFVYHL